MFTPGLTWRLLWCLQLVNIRYYSQTKSILCIFLHGICILKNTSITRALCGLLMKTRNRHVRDASHASGNREHESL
jgi:hypothetical protein